MIERQAAPNALLYSGAILPELVDMPDNPRKNFADVLASLRDVPASSISVVGQGILEGAIFSS